MRKFTVILSAAIVALTTAVTMSPAEAGSYKVTASITTSSAQSGDGPVIKGSLSPATPNKLVYLDRYVDGSWTNIATDTTDSSGRYAERLTHEELEYDLGSMKFRTRVYNTAGTRYVSSTVSKTIYGWLNLSYIYATSGDSLRFVDGNRELTVDTNYYADEGWRSNDEGVGYTKWNLQEKCLKLRAFAGLDDYDSSTGAIGRLYVGQDGTKYDYTKTLYQYQVKVFDTLNLHKTQYLSLKSKRLNLDENTVVGVGEPEVLCSKYLPSE